MQLSLLHKLHFEDTTLFVASISENVKSGPADPQGLLSAYLQQRNSQGWIARQGDWRDSKSQRALAEPPTNGFDRRHDGVKGDNMIMRPGGVLYGTRVKPMI